MTETATSNAVAKRRYSNDDLRNLSDFSSVIALAGPIVDIAETELSTGFDVLKDKNLLVGVPFVILEWAYTMGEQGEFVSVVLITKDGRKLILNDGSTGICDQLRKVQPGRPIGVAHGLRKSDYDRKDADGQPILNEQTGRPERATTFYLDTTSGR